jgi:[CysO sulfur-carrier protein]-S-L-cysteine hydrolase
VLRIPRRLLEEMLDHAREEAPRECCGMIAARDDAAVAIHRVTNVAVNRKTAYVMHGQEMYDAMQAIDEAGLEIGAIYHSHPRSEPVPSPTDVNLARNWPGLRWLIVGLDGDRPVVRTWRIDGTAFHEDPHEVDEGAPIDA